MEISKTDRFNDNPNQSLNAFFKKQQQIQSGTVGLGIHSEYDNIQNLPGSLSYSVSGLHSYQALQTKDMPLELNDIGENKAYEVINRGK